MSHIPQPICEIHSIGRNTKERIIGIRGVPLLAEFGIKLAGVSEAREGFSWCRLNPMETQILATVSGRGEVWVNGAWNLISSGFAYVTPQGAPHAYRAIANQEWIVCWVTYHDRLRDPGAFLPATPEVVPCASRRLWHAVEGAYDAAVQNAAQPQTELWVRLMHHTVIQTLGTAQNGGCHLAKLWSAVNEDLARNWTLEDFARIAGTSKENLRRICQRDLGISPMRQLTRLRVSRATELLAFTSDKLLSIAERVGYGDPFSFSVAFKRETGVPPSNYRKME